MSLERDRMSAAHSPRETADVTLGAFRGQRVVIAGATGFVGFHLARLLATRGARVKAIVRKTSSRQRLLDLDVECVEASLEDKSTLVPACEGADYLFHLAGAVDFEGDWDRFERVNVGGTRAVLDAAREAGVNRVVHTSTIAAVGATRDGRVLNEDAVWNLEKCRVPYVTTKRRAEELAMSAAAEGADVVVVNPASIVGPDDFTSSEFGTMCKRFWRRRVPFYTPGGNNFVDVRDVAIGLALAALRGRRGRRYILGGENRTFGDFFKDLARAAGTNYFIAPLPVVVCAVLARVNMWLPGRPMHITPEQIRLGAWYFYFDAGRARCELGFHARPLAESLADAHAFWMKDKR